MDIKRVPSGLLTLLVVAAVASAGAVAAFYVGFSSMGMVTVTSTNPAEWATINTFGPIDVTNSSASSNETIRLINSNSNLTYQYARSETVTPELPAAQCNMTGDITVSAELDGAAVNDGDTVTLGTGTHILVTTVAAVKNACPGNVTIATDFVEQ